MSYEDRVLELFAGATPVTDDADLDQLTRPRLQLIEQGEDAMSDTDVRDINTDRPIIKQENSRGVRVVAAALVALVLGTVAWFALADSGENRLDDVAADADSIAAIEDFFRRWSDGDVRGALSLVGDQDWTEGNVFIEPEMEYVIALEPAGWFWSVTGCAQQVPGTYRCNVALVGDPVLAAMGGAAGSTQFTVEDGKLTQVPRVLGVGAAAADQRLAQFAESQNPAGYEAACVGANGRAWEQNGVVYNRECGAFLAPYLEPLAAELSAP